MPVANRSMQRDHEQDRSQKVFTAEDAEDRGEFYREVLPLRLSAFSAVIPWLESRATYAMTFRPSRSSFATNAGIRS